MANTEFWRDLEARFRELHDEQLQDRNRNNSPVHATWGSEGANPEDQWYLGGSTNHIRTQFEWLAEHAAVRLGHPGGPTALFFWLDLLKAESPYYRGGIQGTSQIGDKVTHSESGVIEFVCKASADYCLKCETQEIIEEQAAVPAQSDPKRRIGFVGEGDST